MNLIRLAVMWVLVVGASYGFSQWLGAVLSIEVNSYLLQAIGMLAALVNATSFQVLRKFDDPPVKHLTPERAERVLRIFSNRRKSFRIKWAMAIAMACVATLAGGLLRVSSLQPKANLLLIVAYAAIVVAITLGILIAVEYSALSRLSRDLPIEMEKLRRKTELLERLSSTSSAAESEKAPTVTHS